MKYTMVKFIDNTYGIKDDESGFYTTELTRWVSPEYVYKFCRQSFEESKETLLKLNCMYKEADPETGEEYKEIEKQTRFTKILNYFNLNKGN